MDRVEGVAQIVMGIQLRSVRVGPPAGSDYLQVGALHRRRYARGSMADSFSHSIRLDVDRSDAWPRLHEVSTWAGIGGISEVSDATHDEGALTGFSFLVEAAGSKVRGQATVTGATEPELLVMAITSSEIVGEITVRLAANDASGTKLRIVLEMRAKGFLAGMFYPIIAQTVGKNLPTQVEEFGRLLSA
jgi:hypothetical protein